MHMRVHTGEKPFLCDHEGCGKAFAQSGSLVSHKRTHTGEKPFVCDHDGCGWKFARKDHLDQHMRVHTGEKNFVCDHDGCGRAFARVDALLNHTRRDHTGERPHSCPDDNCGAAFVTSSDLKQHFDNNHSKEAGKRRKLQERAMVDALVMGGHHESFAKGHVPAPGEFIREVYFDHRCALARNFRPGEKKFAYVDFVVHTKKGRLVFLEVDEGQHPVPAYSQLCETTRMWNICESIALADLGGGINVFWLRVNPDSVFKINDSNHARERKQRFQEVLKFLDAIESSETDPPIQIGYAFYNCTADHRPLVLSDPEYHESVRTCVVCIQEGSKLVQPRAFPPLNPIFQPMDMNVCGDASESD